jgi:hypothetical protein
MNIYILATLINSSIHLYNLISAFLNKTNKKTNSMVWVRERTIPTERPPLVGEVLANLCG